MDLLRSTIEAIFYHFPITYLSGMLIENDDDILPIVSEIVKWERQEFSSTEISILGNILENEWMINDTWDFDSSKYSKLSRIFTVINQFTSCVLKVSQNRIPKVKFDQLLRWRDTSLMVGEDLLTMAFIAENDLKQGSHLNEFAWPDVLDHDNFRLNEIIDNELSDTHSHINAAIAVFDFNWISLMNYPHLVNIGHTKKKGFLKDGAMQSYDPVCRYSHYDNLTLAQWIQTAAAIRIRLFDEILNEHKSQCDIAAISLSEAIQDPLVRARLANETEFRINTARSNALKTKTGFVFDYAIRQSDSSSVSRQALTSAYMVHHGERKLLYEFFYNYFGNSKHMREWAPWIYLYVLIKNKVRREFIQTNPLVGFDNFDDYQKSKSQFRPRFDKHSARQYDEIVYKYAVQTALGPDQNHYLEARMTPSNIKRLQSMDYRSSIFGDEKIIADNKKDHLTFVAHFIKSKDRSRHAGMLRHGQTLHELWGQINSVISHWEYGKNNNPDSDIPKLVGIDAASSEFNCRPEVFAPIFRYARFQGLSNQTFHAGEDFYDLLDGIRTIDETIFYMGFTLGCRIGHGLALGMPAAKYYKNRHNTMVIPKQILLDNLVWLKYRAKMFNITLSSEVQLLIEQYYTLLGPELGYPECDTYTYWQSMLHRGDMHEPISVMPKEMVYTLPEEHEHLAPYAKQCLENYLYSSICMQEGDKAITLRLPSSFSDDVQKLQNRMKDEIGQKGIVIECNPSSNLKIGRFNRYDEHPIFYFHPINSVSCSTLCVSINTDDRGVFATSLRNEFSLISASMYKQMDANGHRLWTDVQIEEYIKRIVRYGNLSRFPINR